MAEEAPPASVLTRARMLIVVAAILWSLSGFFKCILTHKTALRLGDEPVSDLAIAFYRVLFAGLVLVPTLRRGDLTFRPRMVGMVLCFAAMNFTFVLALAGGKAANAILLQYTAPIWMFLASIGWLGEKATGRGWATLILGLLGVTVIVGGEWQGGDLPVIGLGLASGFFYAGVVIFLRVLRGASSNWLTVLNHLGAAAAVAPLLLIRGWPTLNGPQLGVMILFGGVQMGIPYLLMARGLRTVGPQEAGVITLLEPLLNPLWAYLVAPDSEAPTLFTLLGGSLILAALAWRYWPSKTTP